MAGLLAATACVLLPAVWGSFALWYRIPGARITKKLCAVTWAAFSLAVLAALWNGRLWVTPVFAIAFACLLHWWRRLSARNDLDWADDVARITHGTVEGSRVTLHNVRNFSWRTVDDYTPCWETRAYDLDRLRAVDMILSYWRGPAIAHMVISFGFDTGEPVVFSVEIRRRKTQAFSEIGGFFKEFELCILACDERDAVRLRTNVRREQVFMYRLRLPPTAMRALFLSYVEEANRLLQAPRFYHTITVNCTTLVYQMMRRIVGHLPLSYRLLFSGYIPQYVYSVGGLDKRFTFEELRERGRISERARAADGSATFSADIRRGLPGAG